VWFATLPDDIRESITSPISDPRTSFRAEPIFLPEHAAESSSAHPCDPTIPEPSEGERQNHVYQKDVALL